MSLDLPRGVSPFPATGTIVKAESGHSFMPA
jgi:hypothetical protein